MPFAELTDVSIHYRFDGAGTAPVVMLSNSLGTNLSMWDALAAAHLSNIEAEMAFTSALSEFLAG